jgi:non-ribosomal peptide synthetase component F
MCGAKSINGKYRFRQLWFISTHFIIDISQIIGIVAIEMSGSVYCPLSPRDPEHRLHSLLQQTQSRLVLVHYLTNAKFNDDSVSLDIDAVLTDNDMESDADVVSLSSVVVTPKNIAYIIFTSGSTGTPKAVSIMTQICH